MANEVAVHPGSMVTWNGGNRPTTLYYVGMVGSRFGLIQEQNGVHWVVPLKDLRVVATREQVQAQVGKR